MPIKQHLVVASTKELSMSPSEYVDEVMRSIKITEYLRTNKSDPTKDTVSHVRQYGHAVELARKVIQIDDELVRRGYRPALVSGKWVYNNPTMKSKAWLEVGAKNVLSFILYCGS